MRSLQIGGCKGSLLTRHSEGNPVQQYCSVTGRANPDAPVTFHAAACLRYNFIERPARKNDSEHHFIGALMQRPALLFQASLLRVFVLPFRRYFAVAETSQGPRPPGCAMWPKRRRSTSGSWRTPRSLHNGALQGQLCTALPAAPTGASALLDSRRWQVPDQSSWRR